MIHSWFSNQTAGWNKITNSYCMQRGFHKINIIYNFKKKFWIGELWQCLKYTFSTSLAYESWHCFKYTVTICYKSYSCAWFYSASRWHKEDRYSFKYFVSWKGEAEKSRCKFYKLALLVLEYLLTDSLFVYSCFHIYLQ